MTDHGLFVAELARFLRPNLYLEVGVAGGHTLRQVAHFAKRAIGIDRSPYAEFLDHEFYLGDYEDLLPDMQGPFDLCFLDADHSYEATKRLFELVWPKVSVPNGIVVLHDTDPPDEEHLHRDRCGGAWEIRQYLADREDLFSITLPAQYGLTMVTHANTKPRFMLQVAATEAMVGAKRW